MDLGKPSGFQIAFLLTALLLLAVPATQFFTGYLPEGLEARAAFTRAFPFIVLGVVFACVAPIRRWIAREVAIPIPKDRRTELLAAWALHIATALAWIGAFALWWDFREGPVALEQRMIAAGSHEKALAEALSLDGLLVYLVLGGLLAPVLEEIVFRGFLYRAWERQFGWIVSMSMTSVVFGLYHANFLPAFMGSVIYVCLYRRTGTLLAPMLVHSLFNIASWYPLLGQFIFPRDTAAPGDVRTWSVQVFCLAFCAIALPLYAWFSRDALSAVRDGHEVEHAPLPR